VLFSGVLWRSVLFLEGRGMVSDLCVACGMREISGYGCESNIGQRSVVRGVWKDVELDSISKYPVEI
jgi:hypothetical protein